VLNAAESGIRNVIGHRKRPFFSILEAQGCLNRRWKHVCNESF